MNLASLGIGIVIGSVGMLVGMVLLAVWWNDRPLRRRDMNAATTRRTL